MGSINWVHAVIFMLLGMMVLPRVLAVVKK